jgi:phenylacetate-coenzyme A ligase PaaK-like adenylate-forming protein
MGVASASWDCLRAGREGPAGISARKRSRFAAAVSHARSASPLYRELYADVPEGAADPELLPPTTKAMLMDSFDDWVTDPRVRLTEVREFLEDPGRIGEPFLGDYLTARSTGTSGLIGFVVKDRPETVAQNAIRLRAMLRWLAPGDLARLASRGARTAAITATGRHYLGITTMGSGGMRRRAARIISAQAPIAEIVPQLNDLQPAILTGFASMISILASEQEAGRLRISPVLVTSSAETLAEEERQRVARTFQAKLGNTYATAECPFIAHSCEHGRLHLNEDWVLFEPVDAQDVRVPPGEIADGALVSNLANRVQPILRYRLDDAIVMAPDPCPCGSPFRAIEVLERHLGAVRFAGEAGEIQITSSILGTAVGPVGGITAFQLEQTAPAAVRLRLRFAADADPELAWRVTEEALRDLLAKKGAGHVTVERGEEPPQPGAGGKYPKLIPLH